MIKLVAIGFTLVLGSVAQAMPPVQLQAPDSLIVNVREDCGAGFTRVNGRCVRTPARAAARRCATGMTLVEGRCTKGTGTTEGQAPHY
jgi:hypothetical protein